MESKTTTQQILKVLYIFSWIIFIGLCVEAGAIIFNAFFTLTINPLDVKYLWKEIDLSALYQSDPGHFFIETLLISIVAILKAYLFYLIVIILHHNKLNLSQPFNKKVGSFIFKVSYLSFGIGLFSLSGAKYAAWLISQGIDMPDIQYLQLGGADVWLFMGITLFVIAQIFKRGIEIQSENELTI
ncbi:hypothetical protein D9M68_686220 [compost metagenome]